MNFPKFFAFVAIVLFVVIGIMAYFKGDSSSEVVYTSQTEEINIEDLVTEPEIEDVVEPFVEEDVITEKYDPDIPVPEADRVEELFSTTGTKLDIVETVYYTKKVSWLRGRPAWLVDYANHYSTSRYFISRSLARKPDYFYQNYSNGDSFNVFKKDKNFSFHLVVDISRNKLWLYSFDEDASVRTLIKNYNICLGRLAETKSGSLTPIGKYSLGDRVAIYKPGMRDFFNNNKIEMISVFGTRWIPFNHEIENCSAPAKGLGIHGSPWVKDERTGEYKNPTGYVGKYESDGCIRLSTEDIEELYAIIISKPSTIEIVKDFHNANLPGKEL